MYYFLILYTPVSYFYNSLENRFLLTDFGETQYGLIFTLQAVREFIFCLIGLS